MTLNAGLRAPIGNLFLTLDPFAKASLLRNVSLVVLLLLFEQILLSIQVGLMSLTAVMTKLAIARFAHEHETAFSALSVHRAAIGNQV